MTRSQHRSSPREVDFDTAIEVGRVHPMPVGHPEVLGWCVLKAYREADETFWFAVPADRGPLGGALDQFCRLGGRYRYGGDGRLEAHDGLVLRGGFGRWFASEDFIEGPVEGLVVSREECNELLDALADRIEGLTPSPSEPSPESSEADQARRAQWDREVLWPTDVAVQSWTDRLRELVRGDAVLRAQGGVGGPGGRKMPLAELMFTGSQTVEGMDELAITVDPGKCTLHWLGESPPRTRVLGRHGRDSALCWDPNGDIHLSLDEAREVPTLLIEGAPHWIELRFEARRVRAEKPGYEHRSGRRRR